MIARWKNLTEEEEILKGGKKMSRKERGREDIWVKKGNVRKKRTSREEQIYYMN